MTRRAPQSSLRRFFSARAWCAIALALALPVALTGAGCERAAEPGALGTDKPQAVAALDPRTDPRLSPLFGPCEHDGYYDVDTSDPIAILEETLLTGQLDPIRRARVELAEAGTAGLAVARRILDEYLDQPAMQGWVRNALDVVALSKEPAAHELVLRALNSPSEELRALALRMMHRRGTAEAPEPGQGRPEDFDAVLAAMEIATATTIRDCGLVLYELDPARAEAVYLQWMESGALPGMWQDLVPYLAASTRPETIEWCRAHYRDALPAHQAYLAACAARAGDAEALALLHADATGEVPERRGVAVAALATAGLTEELERLLATELPCTLRVLALRELARSADGPNTRGLLHQATGDACEDVRFFALETLCARRDERAYERALVQLDSTNSIELTLTMRALREHLPHDPAFAERVLERLLARHEREARQSAGERASILQSIGQVPLARAAEFLLERARTETEPIQSFEPHRWLCLQAANSGAAGTSAFLAELARERDPRRRIDLLESLAAPGNESARAALLELVQGDTLAPLELVYAAERLTALGPVARIAPVLKRVTLRVEEPTARRALQCLLWRSYPSKKRG